MVLVSLIGCKDTTVTQVVDNSVVVKVSGVQPDAFMDCIESISLLPLERCEIFDEVVDPGIAVSDSCIFIVDHALQSYVCPMLGFSQDGSLRFAKRLKGRGPGEVLEVSNYYVKDNRLCIFDGASMKINQYDSNGQYIDKISAYKIMKCVDMLFPIDSAHYMGFYTSDPESKEPFVEIYNNKFNCLSGFLDLPDAVISLTGKPNTYSYRGKTKFVIPFLYGIYSTDDSCRVSLDYSLQFDKMFNDSDLKELERKEGYMDRFIYECTSPNARHFYAFAETDRYLTFRFSQDNDTRVALYDKIKQETYALDLVLNNDLKHDVFAHMRVLASNQDNIYAYILYDALKSCVEQSRNSGQYIQLIKDFDSYSERYNLEAEDYVFIKVKMK